MLRLPVEIIKFWYLEAPFSLFNYFLKLNKSFFNAFSVGLMLRTFFRPWKNEYREGLVKFSIFMGIVFKSLFLIADLILFALLLACEVVIFLVFVIFPIAIFYMPFIKL